MCTKDCRKRFVAVVSILAILLLGGAATVASAFSVDVKKLYYADYTDPSTTRRVINYDFSAGSAVGNTITIPAGPNGVAQVPTLEVPPLTYTFGPYPGAAISATLDTVAKKATLTSATNGGLIINTTATPNTPPVPQWVFAVALTNFADMTDATKEYNVQIGFGSITPGPHPEFAAAWVPVAGGGRSLVLRGGIFNDIDPGTYTWGPFTVPVSGVDPSTGVIVLRIRCLDPATGGNNMVFDYSLNGGTNWTTVDTLTPVDSQHVSFPGKFPFVSARVESNSENDPFQVSSQHWNDAQGNVYHAWPRVNDFGQALYSAVSMNSPGYIGETALAFNSAAGYWSLSGTLFSDDFTDNTVDGAKWTTTGNSVTESDGNFKVAQAATDAGGTALSRDIPINPYAPIVVQRRAYVHAANSYFDGLLALYFGADANVTPQNNTFSVIASHANFIDNQGTVPANGFYLGRYPAHLSSATATTSAIWDAWFDEKISYNPVSGVAELYINNELKATINVGALPAGTSHLKVYLNAWGWYMGHYNYSDDLIVSQPWNGGNVFLSSNTQPAEPVVFNFTATRQGGGTVTETRTITGYVTEFATNLLPVGDVSSTPTFTWTGIANAAEYAVQVSDANGNRIWNKYNLPSSTTSAVYGVNGTPAPALVLGQTYTYDIVAGIQTNGVTNHSFAKGTFNYATPLPSTLSFSGWVKTTPNWPSTNGMQPAVGAQVSAFSPTAPSTPLGTATVDATTGAFTLTGIPQSSNFYLAVHPPEGYLPVLSKFMNWNANIQALLPFVLFTPTQYAAFGAGENGMILGRVALQSSPTTTFLSGATIEAREWLNGVLTATTYPVTYNSVAGSTGADGIYMVKNVPTGTLVQLTATLAGYTFDFNGAVMSSQSGIVSEESFFGTPPQTISFSGFVLDKDSTAVGGALIEKMGAMPKTTTSNTDGSYALTGLPAGVPFHLKLSKDIYAPAYTGDMGSTVNIVNTLDQAFNLFPASQLTTWGIEAGKGIIRARVRDQARNVISGVVISAASQFGQTYQVCYDDGCTITSGNGGTTQATGSGAGRYVIKNVLPGDVVTVTAAKPGWTFGSRIYHTYADGISQGGITGTAQGADEQSIRNGFVSAVAAINAGNAEGFMAFVSNWYLNNGETKADFGNKIQGLSTAGGQLAYVIGTISIQGDMATVAVTWTMTMGGQQEVNPETLIFRKEGTSWLIYGNQLRYAIRANSQHWADGYRASFTVEDATRQINSVTVTGPGITSSLSLTSHEQVWDYGKRVNVWWNESGSPFIGTSIPSTPPTYTITVTEGTANTVYNYNRQITGWVPDFATNIFPVGQAGGPVVFTWTGITGAATYAVELNNNSYSSRLWEKNGIPPTQTWAIYDGANPLVQDNAYRYWIVSRDAGENASFTEGQFTYSGTTGISFTQQVTAAATGAALQGVTVTLAGNPNPTPSATSDASGNFTLTGVPAGSNFTVKMDKAGFRPTYTSIQRSLSNIGVGIGAPYNLFTPADTTAWPPMNFATKGAIATRVVDSAGVMNIAGAVVTAQSALHPNVPYSVTYRDDAGTFGGATTYGNGRFYVLGVDEGDIVTVTAVKNGYTFQTRTFLTRAGGISQGRVYGTVGPFSGDVNHDGRLTLADAILVLQVTAGIPPSAAIYLDGDVNRDSMLDLAELLYVLQSVAGLR